MGHEKNNNTASPTQLSRKRRCALKLSTALLPAAIALGACVAPEPVGSSDQNAVEVEGNYGVALPGATDARLLPLNEDGLEAKLQVIDNAQAGDTLDLTYYLFSEDESSAFLASRLIAAAKRGVQVRVVVDFMTNFARHHYYQWITYAADSNNTSGGSVAFRYYNTPSQNIRDDVRFLVTPCSIPGELINGEACNEDRRAHQNDQASFQKATWFLTGLYGKNQLAMQAALGDVVAQFEEAAASSEGNTVENAAMAQGLKLLFNAKVKNSFGAQIALFFLADTLAPLSEAVDSLNLGAAFQHREDWQHISDFTHQKLTLRTSPNGSEMVAGGRNLENSYHLSELPPTGSYSLILEPEIARSSWESKYSFLDMDVHLEFQGDSVRQRYDRLWNFSEMVKEPHDFDLGVNPGLQLPNPETGEMERVLDYYGPDYLDMATARFLEHYSYDNGVLNAYVPGPALSRGRAGQLPQMQADGAGYFYIENVPNPGGPNSSRVFGTGGVWDGEQQAGKNIHALWLAALDDVCRSESPKEVVIHNAYLILPTRFQQALQEAVTSPDSCPGVSKFVVITNSRESTDLNVINIFNESYIKPMIDRAPAGRLDYFEYTTNELTAANPVSRSLHTKVMIFGDDLFVGSANADGRSKFMDANNGVYIQNAPQLVNTYKQWISSTVLVELAARDPHGIQATAHEALLDDNMAFFKNQILDRWVGDNPALHGALGVWARELATQLYQVSDIVLPGDGDDGAKIDTMVGVEDPSDLTNQEVMEMTDEQLQLL